MRRLAVWVTATGSVLVILAVILVVARRDTQIAASFAPVQVTRTECVELLTRYGFGEDLRDFHCSEAANALWGDFMVRNQAAQTMYLEACSVVGTDDAGRGVFAADTSFTPIQSPPGPLVGGGTMRVLRWYLEIPDLERALPAPDGAVASYATKCAAEVFDESVPE